MKKTLNLFVLAFIFVMLIGFVPAPQPACNGNSGSIWTTTGTCGDPQNENHYNISDKVFINGANFCPGTYDWEIKGQPGNASCNPNIVVASGSNYVVDASGAFCFEAYTVQNNNCGEYKAYFDGKHDNYNVVPEFGTMVGILTALGALGVFFLVRKK